MKKKEKSKDIGVIIVSHNNKDIIPRCLNSLKNQSYKNFEAYLIDDSEDDTENYVKKRFPFVKYFRVEDGVSGKRNFGISKSNSEYIITLDSDAILSKDWIKNAKEYMDKHKEDRKSTRLNSSHTDISRMPSSA